MAFVPEETQPAALQLPKPTMLSVIVALGLAEIEAEMPGFLDRLIARLSSDALRSQVVRIRGERARPEIIEAQETALLWLTTLSPLLRGTEAPKKRRRKA